MGNVSKPTDAPSDRCFPETPEERPRPDFSRFVAVDIETTGLEPSSGEIIELGAALFVNGEEKSSYHALLQPEAGLPERNRRLTGIDPEMLASGQAPKAALEGLLAFVGGDLLACHNAPFDTGFLAFHLDKHGLPPLQNTALCTLHMAALVNPEAQTLQLGELARQWGVSVTDPHRALQDARSAGHLALRLMDDIRSWPKQFLAHLASYRGKSLDALFDLLDFFVGEGEPIDESFRLDKAVWDRIAGAGNTVPPLAFVQPDSYVSSAPESDSQLWRQIAEAFKHGGVTLLEDIRPGSGPASRAIPPDHASIGRLAVAVPDDEVLRQVLGPDDGSDSAPGPDGMFYLGRRSEYICLRRAFGRDGRPFGWLELSPYERIVLARWLAGTRTGRIGRVNWWLLNNFSGLKGHLNALNASGLECIGYDSAHEGPCFAESARSRSEVVNHLVVDHRHLLTPERGGLGPERLLDPINTCIIESADRLTEAAREARARILELDPLVRRLALAASSAEEDGAPSAGPLRDSASALKDILETARRTLRAYRDEEGQDSGGPVRVDEDTWALECFAGLADTIRSGSDRLRGAAEVLTGIPDLPREHGALATVVAHASETLRWFQSTPAGWAAALEGAPLRSPKRVVLRVTPVDVSEAVRALMDEGSRGILAVGRHLRHAGSFDRLRSEWGISENTPVTERVLEDPSVVPPPLFLPVDIAPPVARSGRRYYWLRYMERTANLLRILAEALGGRTVAAFSAHHELRKVRDLLESSPPRDCVVLAQYRDGTKSAIIREYLSNPATLLLGGRSFLDRVDFRPAGFTALVVVKLPFASPEEPVHRVALTGLEERGLDGMTDYLVPHAVDAANRWIDSLVAGPIPPGTSPDLPAGAVVLLDPRPMQNEWGEDLIGALNAGPVRRIPFREMVSELRELAGSA